MSTKRLVTLAMTIGTAFVGAVGATVAAATLHVPGDFATIQACIDAAVSGVDECVVAPGTYHEMINFLGNAITVRSSGGADVTTIDAAGLGGSVVTCISGEGPDTVLDGFTITGGTGTEIEGYTAGGGMFNYDSSPRVTNCTFTGNTATVYDPYSVAGLGGGMYNFQSSPRVTNCTFRENTATNSGGGIHNDDSSPTVTNCTFIRNTAGAGGGMFNYGVAPTVTNCTFSGNTGTQGGGVFNWRNDAKVANCVFSGNTGNYGGGMYNLNCSPTLTNCTFSGNKADYGGGMYNSPGGRYPVVTNCTFSGNTATNAGGGMYNRVSTTLTNCILWDDSPDEIATNGLAAAVIRFSDVQGGLPVGATDGGGNLDLDPTFVRLPNPGPDGTWDGVDDDYGDLRLQAGSPCIDAGDPAFVAQPGEADLEGHARVLCGRVDMGAYEFGIGDYDCDQVVDLADFSSWQACMAGPLDSAAFHSAIDIRQSTIGCESFDFDGDGSVSLLDFSGFQRVFAP